MYCPKCYIKFPSGETRCPQCGGSGLPRDTQPPTAPIEPDVPRQPKQQDSVKTMPMTGKQRWAHFVMALIPLLFVTVPIMGIFTLISPKNFTLIPLFIVIGLIIIGTYLNKNLIDFFNGVVNVESDQLLKIELVYVRRRNGGYVGRGNGSYVAFFKRLGDLRMDDDLYKAAKLQAYYHIMYSPNTRKIWKMKLESHQIIPPELIDQQQTSQLSTDNHWRETATLSPSQRLELAKFTLHNIIPGLVIFLFTYGFIEKLISGNFSAVPIGYMVFIGILGFHVIQLLFKLIDLITGKVENATDTLIDVDVSPRFIHYSYTANFQKLGKTTINRQQYSEMLNGAKYRIAYSRWSKQVWQVQKIT